MKFTRDMLTLYLVTDRRWLKGRDFIEVLQESIDGGVTMIQLREKDLSHDEFLELAWDVKDLCEKNKIPFLINDNVEVAKEVDADGVHIGQDDMNYLRAREVLGKDKIIGLSCTSVEQGLEAEKMGVDYIGVGGIFTTSSKDDADYCGVDGTRAIKDAVDLPIVGIGGINPTTIRELKGTGIDGISVISAILDNEDIEGETRKLYRLTREVFYEGSSI